MNINGYVTKLNFLRNSPKSSLLYIIIYQLLTNMFGKSFFSSDFFPTAKVYIFILFSMFFGKVEHKTKLVEVY